MYKIRSFTIIFIFVIAALGLTISSARAAILTVDGGGQLTGATNVDLGSLGFFNVTFVDGTCIDLFTGCDAVSDFDFDNPTDATTAANALMDQVFVDNHISAPGILFDFDPSLTRGCEISTCNTIIPYAILTFGTVPMVRAKNSFQEVSDGVFLENILNSTDFSLGSDVNFARFTTVAAVPLPPAALLFVSALVGLAGFTRRQRQAQRKI